MQRLGVLLHQSIRALADNLAGERERWILWFPVVMGGGVALYFSLPVEPSLTWGLAALAGMSVLLGLSWRRPLWRCLILGLFAGTLGFAAAEFRTAMVAAPMLADKVKGVQVRWAGPGGRVPAHGPARKPRPAHPRRRGSAAGAGPRQARPRLSDPRSRRPRPPEGHSIAALAAGGAGLLRFPPRPVLRPHRRGGLRIWAHRRDAFLPRAKAL
jgi:hypothetical protein